jgi:hypothetical protein
MQVRKRETFQMLPPTLAFGRCRTRERSKMLRIEINNMTSSLRTVTLRHGDMSTSCCGVKVHCTLTYADVC